MVALALLPFLTPPNTILLRAFQKCYVQWLCFAGRVPSPFPNHFHIFIHAYTALQCFAIVSITLPERLERVAAYGHHFNRPFPGPKIPPISLTLAWGQLHEHAPPGEESLRILPLARLGATGACWTHASMQRSVVRVVSPADERFRWGAFACLLVCLALGSYP